MEPNYKRIGLRIRQKRRECGFSQAELAEQVELSATYVSLLERGRKHLTLDTAAVLAEKLGCSLGWLLTGGDNFNSSVKSYSAQDLELLEALFSDALELLKLYEAFPSEADNEASDCKH